MSPDETPPEEPRVTDLRVADEQAGARLDAFLASQFPLYSRSQLRRMIDAGRIEVDGRRVKVAYRLHAEQRIRVCLAELPRETAEPENIPLQILYEDESMAAIDKPPGMVVHPAKGHRSGTLVAALAYHFNQLSEVGGAQRPGIVHRLDRDTSGVIVVAKTDAAHLALAKQFEQRKVEKEYFAIVVGSPDRDRDSIKKPIGVHPYQREKMAIRHDHPTSRSAETFFEVMERFVGYAVLRALPKTGRTHQIRLHLAHIGHPVLCDRLYAGHSQITVGQIRRDDDQQVLLARQALHARRLKLNHPVSGQSIEFQAPLPTELQTTLDQLREFRSL